MNQQQFADYLFKGLGRPYLYLQQHPTTAFHDALLHACLYNPRYDPQCEGSRTEYLHGLIELSPDASSYTQLILDALADPDDEMALEQLFDFALIFAQRDDASARRVLYEQSADFASVGDTVGARQLIQLDGIEGFLFVAQRLGEAIDSETDFWDYDYVFEYLEAHTEADQLHEVLAHARSVQPFVDRYLTPVEQFRAGRKQAADQRQAQDLPSFAALSAAIRENPRAVGFVPLRNWGRGASSDEIERAARTLLTVADPKQLVAYLTIFGDRAFPLDMRRLFRLAWHEDDLVSLRTLQILTSVQHPDVRALAFELLEDDPTNGNALALLTHNYQPGDEQFMATLVAQAADHHAVHSLTSGINDVFEQNPMPGATDLLLTLYERSPCSICRGTSIDLLIECDALPAWIVAEARYDANEAIRDAVLGNKS
ncbi:MAG: hypothetical protein JOZ51_01335 [Chloroflexi bacterium]|nr:hypothetical protein [Chloroflexota bacterium]